MIKPEATNIQGICIKCNVNVQTKHSTKNGVNLYRPHCDRCHKQKYYKKFKYKLHRKSYCERCGFKPEHQCQLDVDHIDGNRNNSEANNLQTLCANCHRIKTYNNKDWQK